MVTTRTERSALLALILSVIVLLLSYGSEAGGSPIGVFVSGVLAGAGIAFAIMRAKPGWFLPSASRTARERCDEIHQLLVAEMNALEEAQRRPIAPIRMERTVDSTPSEDRRAA